MSEAGAGCGEGCSGWALLPSPPPEMSRERMPTSSPAARPLLAGAGGMGGKAPEREGGAVPPPPAMLLLMWLTWLPPPPPAPPPSCRLPMSMRALSLRALPWEWWAAVAAPLPRPCWPSCPLPMWPACPCCPPPFLPCWLACSCTEKGSAHLAPTPEGDPALLRRKAAVTTRKAANVFPAVEVLGRQHLRQGVGTTSGGKGGAPQGAPPG